MKYTFILLISVALGGCMTAAKHSEQLGSAQDRAVTLGLVQKKIRPGISQADVAEILGSPNIVTGDSRSRETWIYDKVATEASYSTDSGGSNIYGSSSGSFVGSSGSFWGPTSISGNAGSSYSKSAGAVSLTQRTLTVVIKFSSGGTVQSVSYNSTRF